jgi:2-dehydro-3-deoxygluconokinase
VSPGAGAAAGGAFPRVVTFGEVLLRLSPDRPQERLFQSPALRTYFGGAEANVAAGLAALGVPADHVTRLPDNPLGDAALAALRAAGVGTAHVARGGARMGIYFVEGGADLRPLRTVYDRAGSAFAEVGPADLDWDAALRGAGWFHVTGINPALGDGPLRAMAAGLDAARAHGVPVSVDLNWRPLLWQGRDPRPALEPVAARADLLVANPGAVEVMLGIATAGAIPEPPDALAETARRVHERFGCREVALTQRETVSASEHAWRAHLWAAADGVLHSAPAYRVRVVDRVGGGDSFVAALLYARFAGRAPADAVRFATAASALKLTIPGDQNRVTAAEVDHLLSHRA